MHLVSTTPLYQPDGHSRSHVITPLTLLVLAPALALEVYFGSMYAGKDALMDWVIRGTSGNVGFIMA